MKLSAFTQGEQSFQAGINVFDNPYPYHSEPYFNWIRGYSAARKAITVGPYCEWPRTCYDGTCIWPEGYVG